MLSDRIYNITVTMKKIFLDVGKNLKQLDFGGAVGPIVGVFLLPFIQSLRDIMVFLWEEKGKEKGDQSLQFTSGYHRSCRRKKGGKTSAREGTDAPPNIVLKENWGPILQCGVLCFWMKLKFQQANSWSILAIFECPTTYRWPHAPGLLWSGLLGS